MKKFKIKTIANYLGVSTKELAERAGISYNHLCGVMSGNARMTADDLIKLMEVSGFNYDEISIEQK